jgi:hypothetical protein
MPTSMLFSKSSQRLGYEYPGDKGNEGGFLFILEDRPRHRLLTSMSSATVTRNGGATSQSESGFGRMLLFGVRTQTSSAASLPSEPTRGL